MGGSTSIRQVADRLQGARRAVKEEPDATLEVLEAEGQTVLAGRSVGNMLVERGRADLPDGIFCANDLLALGVMQSLTMTHTFSIPGDVALIGYDDIDFAALRGKVVGVLGAGASALDNAAVALEHGASRVHLFCRRPAAHRARH